MALFSKITFNSTALYDIGLTWGKLADKKLFKDYFTVYTSSGYLSWNWNAETPLTEEYINSHISQSYLIPANRNIMAAFVKIKKSDKVKLEGELVDIKYISKYGKLIEYHTSLSRSDDYENSRGNGSAETIYVTKVQIGNHIYK